MFFTYFTSSYSDEYQEMVFGTHSTHTVVLITSHISVRLSLVLSNRTKRSHFSEINIFFCSGPVCMWQNATVDKIQV